MPMRSRRAVFALSAIFARPFLAAVATRAYGHLFLARRGAFRIKPSATARFLAPPKWGGWWQRSARRVALEWEAATRATSQWCTERAARGDAGGGGGCDGASEEHREGRVLQQAAARSVPSARSRG